MPSLKYRSGGGWAVSGLSGAVTFGGDRIPFGPPTGGGTITEFFTFPTPVNPDWSDSNTNVAVRFAVEENGDFMGVRYWRPATPFVGGTVFGFNDDTLAVIAPPVAEDAGQSLGAWNEVLFTTPVAIVPGVNYLACYHTNRYGFTRVSEGATVPFLTDRIFTDSSGMSDVSKFRFGGENSGGEFSSSPNFHFNISPIVRFPA